MLFGENEQDKIKKYPFLHEYTTPVKVPERDIIGREVEMRQLNAAMMRPELCNVILLGEAGSGKALINSTPIAVNDIRGYVPIGDLRKGDIVFDDQGIPTKIVGVFPQGKKKVYRVTFSDGSYVDCNDEHLWTVRDMFHRKTPSFGYHTLTLRELMNKGLYVVNKKNNVEYKSKRWYIPKGKAVDRENVHLPIAPYALGALIGDGCLTNDVLTISCKNEKIAKRVAKEIGALDVYGFEGNLNWCFVRDNTVDGKNQKYISIDDMNKRMPESGVFGKKAKERRIPPIYFRGSIVQRMELLHGLMDTDGGILHETTIKFMASNEGLGEDMVKLARSLGFRASLNVKTNKGRTSYVVYFHVSDDEKSNLFLYSKYKERVENGLLSKKVKTNVVDIAIVSVEDLGYEEEMTCIKVDSANHLFQAGECHIVTHNTMLVQGTMMKDKQRAYLEVDLSKMIANLSNENEMADKLKQLFNETQTYREDNNKEIVLFIDEFHQIVQLSAAAVEVLKPLLADSGTRGIRVIAATTYIEFRKWIAPNQPLVERLQRINITQPDKAMTVAILKGMATRYGVADQFYSDQIYEAIYEYTNRYIPANSQPRKSILVLDSMIGWARAEHRPLDLKLLADVIYESEGVNVAFRVDATSIKKEIDKYVLAQSFASSVIEERLQICVADLNDKTKPMSSFLMTGSTGVGKGLTNDTIVPVYTEDGSVHHKLNGELEIGDYVFNRKGEPVEIVGVFPRGMQDIYEVSLTDGRVLYTDSSHLWTYMQSKGKATENTYTNSTKELYDRGVYIESKDGRHKLKYWIPMNEAVQYPKANLSVHPYVMGAFIGDGCLTVSQLTLSSSDENLVEHVSNLLGGCTYQHNHRNYNWTFPLLDKSGRQKSKQTKTVFADYPEVCGKLANEKRIPEAYMYASIEQRWQLVKGLFDTDGSIGGADEGRYNVSYSTTSEGLVYDLQNLLYSLGVASTIQIARTAETGNGHYVQYRLNVKSSNENKDRFFWLPRKVEIANKAKLYKARKESKSHKKDYHWVGIADIRKLNEQQETTCIYVDDEEHLYQAGQYVVSHNTEMTKQLARILFEDDRNLIRFDMTEYANPDTLERFRNELTARVWEHPYSIVLLDEIEKACAPVTRILLQVLDDGRLMDENNREVSFSNLYIVLTTNAGSEIYRNISQYNADDAGSGVMMKKYNKLIRDSISGATGDNRFPPELLGRIDCIVPFQPLSENTMKEIVKMKLTKLKKEVKIKHDVDLRLSKKIIQYLVEDNLDTDSNSGGARIVMSKLEQEVTTSVARFINAHPDIKNIGVDVEGEMASDNKYKVESNAYIKVAAIK